MGIKRKSVMALALGVCAAVSVVLSQGAGAYIRPKGATPLRVAFVPAFKQCTSPNNTHGAPLAFPSCTPPVQASSYLTVGTPDANGAAANSVGFARLDVVPPSFDGELRIRMSITDVRCLAGTATSVCSTANAADGPDYSGELRFNATIRITDYYNGQNLNEPATVQDIPFPVTMTCASTADTSTGGVCSFTTGPCMIPEGCSTAGRRTVIEFGQLYVTDGGSDGSAGTTQDNTLFMRQGLFIP
jgi:hypothetical protein